jgi:hypothetical protein
MKAFICLALVFACAFAVEMRPQSVFAQTSSKLSSAIQKVRANAFGDLLVSLAEIHMATAGPLEDLKQALADLSLATSDALSAEHQSYNEATERHNSEVERWNQLISAASADIAAIESLLTNILYPRKEHLESEIANLEANIASNIAITEQETADREAAHEEFLTKESEYELAVEAADEALTLLEQLRNGEVSLAQVRVAQNSLKKVQEKAAKLQNNKFGTFLKALAAIAQNFSNQDTLTKVIQLVTDLKSNCVEGLALLREHEAAAIDLWENHRLPQLIAELASLRQSLADNVAELDSTNTAISDNEYYLTQRKGDLAAYTESLVAENAGFDFITSAHNETVDRLTTELNGANAAIELVNSREFSEYFHGQVNQL